MIRKSAAKGYIIRSREEDNMLNITLLEMLRQNSVSMYPFGTTPAGWKWRECKAYLFYHQEQHQKPVKMGCGRAGYSGYILVQQIYHVE
jgi:hypothetical protein